MNGDPLRVEVLSRPGPSAWHGSALAQDRDRRGLHPVVAEVLYRALLIRLRRSVVRRTRSVVLNASSVSPAGSTGPVGIEASPAKAGERAVTTVCPTPAVGRARLRAGVKSVVVVLGAELVVCLAVAGVFAWMARIEDRAVTWPSLKVVCYQDGAVSATLCGGAGGAATDGG